MQTLSTSGDAELVNLKQALAKYFALAHYTSITNAHLEFLVPNPHTLPSRLFFFRFAFTLLRTVLNPSFLLFIPPFIAHIPGYLFSGLGSKYLAPPGEEESKAQFKVILGGLGIGLGTGMSAYWLTRLAVSLNTPLANGGGIRSQLFLWASIAWILIKWHGLLVDRKPSN